MWSIEYKDGRYYLINSETNERRVMPVLTEDEIKSGRKYYDKAYVMCEYLNGNTVYHTRVVNGRKFMYKKHK